MSHKTPASYRADYPAERLEAQLVRFDEWGDDPTAFEEFVRQRRVAVAADLNAFVGPLPGNHTRTLA